MKLMEHNEIFVNGTPRDIFAGNTSIPGVKVYAQVRCTGEPGKPCGHLLARVDVDRWEEDMASRAELRCKCGKTYTLAEYR